MDSGGPPLKVMYLMVQVRAAMGVTVLWCANRCLSVVEVGVGSGVGLVVGGAGV